MFSKRPVNYLLAVVVAVGLAAGCYWATLLVSLEKLQAGIQERDVVKLDRYVNWVVIRDQLRPEIRGTSLRRFYADAMRDKGKPGDLLGALLAGTIAPAMLDQIVDSFVTPQGFVDLLGKNAGGRATDVGISRSGFTNLDEYTIELGKVGGDPAKTIKAVLRRDGLIWRVVHVGFPPGQAPWEDLGQSLAGLKIEKLVPARSPNGLMIEGDIINTGDTARDVPHLRVVLRDAVDRDVQFKIVDPPSTWLAPGAVAHFKIPFERPDDAATGVVVTFAPR
jgi:hypothetical protein